MKWKIIAALLLAGWSYDAIIALRNKKRFIMLTDDYNKLVVKFNNAAELSVLYASKLNALEAPADEFDMIIMHNLLED